MHKLIDDWQLFIDFCRVLSLQERVVAVLAPNGKFVRRRSIYKQTDDH